MTRTRANKSSTPQIIRQRLDRAITQSLSDNREGGIKDRLFCVMINPMTWEVDYGGLAGDDHHGLSEELSTLVELFFVPDIDHPAPVHECIDEAVHQIRPLLKAYEPSKLVCAAQTVLTNRSVPMGSFQSEPDTPKHRQHWALANRARKFVFFQHALDFASTFDFGRNNLERTQTEKRLVSIEKRDWVLKVPHYLAGDTLGVNDQNLRESLFAEYLIATNGFQAEVKAEDLHHYFMPYRGLGQWRAALCWLCPGDEDIAENLSIDRAYRTLSEHILSMSLVDGFMLELSTLEIIDQDGNLMVTGGLHAAARTFEKLWWASCIDFFRDDNLVFHLARSAQGELIPWRSGEKPNLQGDHKCLLTVQHHLAHHQFDTPVLLDLTAISNATPELAQGIFGFDRVLYHIPLMTQGGTPPSDSDLFMHAGELLEPRLQHFIESAAGTQHRRRADRASAYAVAVDTVSHSLKGAVETTGWRRALRMLDDGDASAMDAARQALMRYEIVESHAGVLRLWGICENAEYDKIRTWVDAHGPIAWEDGDEHCFHRYVTLICRIAASICWAKQRDSGYNLAVTRRGSACPLHFLAEPIGAWGGLDMVHDEGGLRIRCAEPPGGSLLDWLRELGSIPPFSGRHTYDPHLALFSPLYEPLLNAMKYAPNTPGGSPTIDLHIEDCRPDAMRVVISNRSQSEVTTPPSIEKISDVYKRTDLAEVSFSCQGDPDGGYLIEVDVRLTPQRLARKILENTQGRKR